MVIPGTPVGVQYCPLIPQAQHDPGPGNLQPQHNAQLLPNYPLQIQKALRMFIPGTPVWVQDTPPPNIQAYDLAGQVPRTVSDPSPIG